MKLLEKVKLGNFELKNRIVMASMTRCRANEDGTLSELLTPEYYEQRSSAGLIITEAINISEQATGSIFTPGIYTAAQIEAWKKVTLAVHRAGGVIFAQLWHTGRVGHSIDKHGHQLPVAPSSVPILGEKHFTSQGLKEFETPHALSLEEIKSVINDYKQATINALSAGFDGVELHCANGYLLNQFLVDGVNKRTDHYGGSIENRVRLILEILQEMINICDGGKVGVKISPTSTFNGVVDSNPVDLYTYLIRRLNELPLAYLQIACQQPAIKHLSHYPKDVLTTFGTLFHRSVVIANGGYTRESAEADIESNKAQLISFGTLFISNPDLPKRFELNAALNSANTSTYYTGGHLGYTDYPTLESSKVEMEEAD